MLYARETVKREVCRKLTRKSVLTSEVAAWDMSSRRVGQAERSVPAFSSKLNWPFDFQGDDPMLFRQEFLDGIRAGTVTLAFRRWRRLSVRGGGTLLTAVGQLSIKAVKRVEIGRISAADARRAGYASKDQLLDELQRRTEGEIYRIELGALRSDPRIALRQTRKVSETELASLRRRLGRLDARAPGGPWTVRTLKALRAHAGVRAADLCGVVGQQKDSFKLNVRKLKNLGLTVSLGTGYRLSPRGETLLELLRNADGAPLRQTRSKHHND